MSQRLIYADEIMEYLDNCCHYSDNPDYDAGYRNGINVAYERLFEASGIDPVHTAGGAYCKECLHSELVEYEDNEGWVTPIDEYWCNEHKITMPLNGFCSEGRKDDMKNA